MTSTRPIPWQGPESSSLELTAKDLLKLRRPATPPIARVESAGVAVVLDESDRGWWTLDWAAAEAMARGTTLTIVYPLVRPVVIDSWGLQPFKPWTTSADGDPLATTAVWDAVERVLAVAPGLPVDGLMIHGRSTGLILGAVGECGLIVMGGRPGSGLTAWLTGETTWAIARRVHRPVAIVDAAGDAPQAAAGDAVGRVVVVLSGRTHPRAPLAIALRAAHRRGVGVTVVHISSPAARGYFKRIDVDDVFRAAQDAFPELTVVQRTVSGRVDAALVRETAGAALVVVSSRDRMRLRRALRRGSPLGAPVVFV